jgi:hypothetical protein
MRLTARRRAVQQTKHATALFLIFRAGVPIFGTRRGPFASSSGANMGEVMSNDVHSHDTAVERAAASDRRTSGRHAAAKLGTVQARLIGGSQVDLVNFSNRGVLFECDSRLLIGARASVRITSPEHNLVVTGRVVRSRVKGLVNGALRYDAALALDHEFALTPALAELMARAGAVSDDDFDASPDREPVDEYLAESEASLAEAVREREVVPTADGPVGEAGAPAADDEPIAFEADGDEVAFEPAVEFAFEEGDAVAFEAAADAGEPMPPPVPEPVAVATFFDATPQPVAHPGVSMFDATPAVAVPDQAEAAVDAGAEVAFEAPIAFEAEDVIDFEPSFEPDFAQAEVAPVDVAPDELARHDATDLPGEPVLEPPSDQPPALPDDRVLQQFAATVPPDLAELRRIAADNQW